MSKTIEQIKQELQSELEKYDTNKDSFKEYYISMKYISEWLQGKEVK